MLAEVDEDEHFNDGVVEILLEDKYIEWGLQGDLSKLQIKSIIIIKPLTCALNPVNPLTASRFAIKALRVYTGSVLQE